MELKYSHRLHFLHVGALGYLPIAAIFASVERVAPMKSMNFE